MDRSHPGYLVLGILVAAVIQWLLAKRLNRTIRKTKVEAKAGGPDDRHDDAG